MGLDDLVKSRLSKMKMFKSGRHTATETGARRIALEGKTKRVGIGKYAAMSGAALTPKGATPQFAAPSEKDIEDMIQPKKRGG